MFTRLKGIRVATGTSGDDRDDIESRNDDTAASTEPTSERDDADTAADADGEDAVATEAADDADASDDTDADSDADADADAPVAVAKKSKAKQAAADKKGKKTPKRSEAEAKNEKQEPKTSFLRQVIEELKKVVTPTGKELWRYVAVVLSFLLIMMVLVMAFDWVFGFISSWIFGEGTQLFPQAPPSAPATPGAPVPTP